MVPNNDGNCEKNFRVAKSISKKPIKMPFCEGSYHLKKAGRVISTEIRYYLYFVVVVELLARNHKIFNDVFC